MTQAQKIAIEELRKQYNDNCQENIDYGSSRICNFHLYENEAPEDDNVTIVMTIIDGISDSFQPYIKTVNVMVEPDGTHFNLADLFPPSKVVAYVQKLKKIS